MSFTKFRFLQTLWFTKTHHLLKKIWFKTMQHPDQLSRTGFPFLIFLLCFIIMDLQRKMKVIIKRKIFFLLSLSLLSIILYTFLPFVFSWCLARGIRLLCVDLRWCNNRGSFWRHYFQLMRVGPVSVFVQETSSKITKWSVTTTADPSLECTVTKHSCVTTEPVILHPKIAKIAMLTLLSPHTKHWKQLSTKWRYLTTQ